LPVHTFLLNCAAQNLRLGLCGRGLDIAGLNFTENASALVVTTSDKGNQFMLAILSKSVAIRMKVPFYQEWSNWFASSIRLPVRFDWRNYAFALSARITIVQFSAHLRVVLAWRYTAWCPPQ